MLWIPLVDCKNTKSMYTVDMVQTNLALNKLAKNPEDWNSFLKSFNGKIIQILNLVKHYFSCHIFTMVQMLI